MNVRAIALALPLVVGIAACKTSSTQSRGETTTASTTEPSQSSESQTTATPQAQPSGEASASGTVRPGEAGGTSQGSATGDTSGTAGGTASGAGTTSDMPGSAAAEPTEKAHSDDQTVTGKVTSVSGTSLAIKSDMGEEKTLQLVPQTSVTIDGQDASGSELKEGQEVRASFNTVEGRDIAVQIEARQGTGPSGSMQGGSTGTSGSMDTGTGTMQGGSTGTGDTGSTGSTTTPDTTTPTPDTTK